MARSWARTMGLKPPIRHKSRNSRHGRGGWRRSEKAVQLPCCEMLWGLALLFPSLALLVATQAFGSMSILLAGTAVSAVSTWLGYRGSLFAALLALLGLIIESKPDLLGGALQR